MLLRKKHTLKGPNNPAKLQYAYMNDELVDQVNPDNQVVRTISKLEAHRKGWLHRTVIAEVTDAFGNIILVRQAPDRQDPGQYVCPVGGHVKSGESILDALTRESMEEIGTSNFSLTAVDEFIYERHVIGRHENHFFIVFSLEVDPAEIILGPESVSYRSFTPLQLKQALTQTPEIFGASYIALLKRCHPQLLS